MRWTQLDQAARGFYFGIGEFASRVLYGMIPIVFAICAWLWIRGFRRAPFDDGGDDTSSLGRSRFFVAAGVSLALTASAFPRADFIHVITIYPAIVLILFGLCRPALLGSGWTPRTDPAARTQNGRFRLESACVALLLMATSFLALRYDAMLTHRIEIDRAALWVKPQHAWLEPLVSYIQEQVPEGESLFVYGHEAQWYYLSDRYTPRSFSQIYPGMTGDETGEELAKLIRETRPRLIIQGVLRWPGMPSIPAYTRQVGRTLNRLYVLDPDAVPQPPRAQMLRVWRLRE